MSHPLLAIYQGTSFLPLLLVVVTQFPRLNSQRRRSRLGGLCTESLTSFTQLMPAESTLKTYPCLPNTVGTGRTISLSWKMCPAS